MPRYLLSVFGPSDPASSDSSSREEMLQEWADTGAFNDKLQRDGHFVFADGLEPVAGQSLADLETYYAPENYGSRLY